MENLNCSLLSKYRNQIMGFSALIIIFAHSKSYMGFLPPSILNLIGYGGVGVVIFAFFSGMGLHQSLDKDFNIKRFLIKRLIRVVIPYIFIASIYYGIKHLLIDNSLILFLEDLSLISWWTKYRGAWFVAWIIPIYLIYPIYFYISKKLNKYKYIMPIISIILILSLCFYINNLNSIMFANYQSMMSATIAFILGDIYSNKVKEESKLWFYLLFLSIIPTFIHMFSSATGGIFYVLAFALCGPFVVGIYCLIMELININIIGKIMSYLGKFTLEIYLTNIFLLDGFKFLLPHISKSMSMLLYITLAIIGIVLSVFISKLLNKLVYTRLLKNN